MYSTSPARSAARSAGRPPARGARASRGCRRCGRCRPSTPTPAARHPAGLTSARRGRLAAPRSGPRAPGPSRRRRRAGGGRAACCARRSGAGSASSRARARSRSRRSSPGGSSRSRRPGARSRPETRPRGVAGGGRRRAGLARHRHPHRARELRPLPAGDRRRAERGRRRRDGGLPPPRQPVHADAAARPPHRPRPGDGVLPAQPRLDRGGATRRRPTGSSASRSSTGTSTTATARRTSTGRIRLSCSCRCTSGRCIPAPDGSSEVGAGDGMGGTDGLPLPPGSGDREHLEVLDRVALPVIEAFAPQLLIVRARQDGHAADTLSEQLVSAAQFRAMAERAAALAKRLGIGLGALSTRAATTSAPCRRLTARSSRASAASTSTWTTSSCRRTRPSRTAGTSACARSSRCSGGTGRSCADAAPAARARVAGMPAPESLDEAARRLGTRCAR